MLQPPLEMGGNRQSGGSCPFSQQRNRCSVVRCPAPSSRCLLRSSILPSLSHLLGQPLSGCLLKAPWIPCLVLHLIGTNHRKASGSCPSLATALMLTQPLCWPTSEMPGSVHTTAVLAGISCQMSQKDGMSRRGGLEEELSCA